MTDACGNAANYDQTINVQDVTAPVITLTGASAIEICEGESYVDAGVTAMDNCDANLPAISLVNPVNTSIPGTYIITYNVADVCNNAAVEVIRTVVVYPVATVNAGADQTICADGTATLSGLFGGAANSATWSTNGDGTFSGNVYTPGSDDITAGMVMLTYTTNDPDGPCGPVSDAMVLTIIPCIHFSGKLIYSRDLSTGVGNGTVTLRNTADNSVLDTETTPADGLYSLTATNIASGSFSVKPVKNVNIINGLTSADALRITQHVVGSNRFTNPFDLVAADVNRNNTVSSQDAALVNGVILGNPLALLQFKTSWRFIPETHMLPTNPAPEQPLFPVPAGFWTFPEELSYTDINTNQMDQDFVGVKLGDVFVSSPPNSVDPANRGAQSLVWKVEDRDLAAGSEITVSFNAEGFRDLAALQFALGFNTEYLEYKGVQAHARMPLNQSHFGAFNAVSGELRTSWYTTGAARSVRNGIPVFQLQFKVLRDGARLSDVLYLDMNVLPAEAYSAELEPRGIMLEFTQGSRLRDNAAESNVLVQDRLLQNQPNPFGSTTQIEFELAESCEAVLSVYDASGRLLWEDRAYRMSGRHSVTYQSTEGQAPGILYYTLRTPGATLTQKMVMVRQE